MLVTSANLSLNEISYFSWIILAVKVAIIVLAVLTISYLLVYRKDFVEIKTSIALLRERVHKQK